MLSITLERMDPRLIELCKCDGKCRNSGAGASSRRSGQEIPRGLKNDPQASNAAGPPATSMYGT